MRKLKKDYTLNYKVANLDYGIITVPKGTWTNNFTSMGYDERYNFVSSYEWIDKNYPTFALILKHDVNHYGINVPIEYLE